MSNLVQVSAIFETFSRVSRQMEQHIEEIVPFVKYLLEKYENDLTRRIAVEIGVRHGGTASLWCELGLKQVIGVDYGGVDSLGEKETLKLAFEMMQQYKNYEFIYGDSHDIKTRDAVLRNLNGNKVDLLFLDGDHSYEGIKNDFNMYEPRIQHDGLVVFHDIVDTPTTRQAKQGVNRFWRELDGNKREFCVNGEWGGIGCLELC